MEECYTVIIYLFVALQNCLQGSKDASLFSKVEVQLELKKHMNDNNSDKS